jgi:hypothetical protein
MKDGESIAYREVPIHMLQPSGTIEVMKEFRRLIRELPLAFQNYLQAAVPSAKRNVVKRE